MTFSVGETVVYPNHGAAVIEEIETRQIKGEDKAYLVLRIVSQNDLVVRVPACNLDLVGVETSSTKKAWSESSSCSVRRTPKSRPTGHVVTRPTSRSSTPETS